MPPQASPVRDLSFEDLRFIFVSGRVCLAFCATVGERWRRSFDRLPEPTDLARWYSEAGVSNTEVLVTETGLAQARTVREAIYRSARAVIEGREPSADDENILNLAAASPPPVPTMARGKLSWAAVDIDSEASALSAVARDAIELLTVSARTRLRECASEHCGLLFLDVSRPGRRCWCSSNACGGKARAAAYRQRSSTSRSGTATRPT